MIFTVLFSRAKHQSGSDDEEQSGAVCAGPAVPPQLGVWGGKEGGITNHVLLFCSSGRSTQNFYWSNTTV